MGYSRAQADQDLLEVERLRTASHAMLAAREIGPGKWLEQQKVCDALERKVNGKLLAVRLSIQDRQNMEKSNKFVWVRWAKGGYLRIKKGQAQAYFTQDQGEPKRLSDQGYVVLCGKCGRGMWGQPHDCNSGPPQQSAQPQNPAEPVEQYGERKLIRVPREDARKLSLAGAMIIWPDDPKADWAEVVEYV